MTNQRFPPAIQLRKNIASVLSFGVLSAVFFAMTNAHATQINKPLKYSYSLLDRSDGADIAIVPRPPIAGKRFGLRISKKNKSYILANKK